MIRHMVFVRFSSDVSRHDRARILSELGALRDHLGGILDFQTRRNESPETAVTHAFNDMFWFDFEDDAARDAYLEDEAHKALGARLVDAAVGGLKGIFVCDITI